MLDCNPIDLSITSHFQARDEAQGMKPSVARKLNEKIRALEAELETLRTNKKVSDLEKKVKVRSQPFNTHTSV